MRGRQCISIALVFALAVLASGCGTPREKTAPGQRGPQGKPRQPALPKPNGPTAQEAAENRAAWERRVKEAEEHKAQVRAKLAKRAQPPASALPTPP